MKRASFTAVAIIMLLFTNLTLAGVSIVMNGSFETDSEGIGDITVLAPKRWCDVNLPSGFYGWISTDWSTHPDGDSNSLTLCWYDTLTNVNNTATVSQQVYLGDVNQITFDIKLDTDWSPDVKWDANEFRAMLLIDGNSIWDSNDLSDGEYSIEVNDININDAELHTLSLAMEVNKVEGTALWVYYRARWDFVKFDTHCGGFGYLPQDLNHDCFVNINDLGALAEQWLAEDPNYGYDLFYDEEDIVNFHDFAVFADYWLGNLMANTYWENWPDPNCYEIELLSADLNNDGIVNLLDFAILSGDWRAEGPCIKGDIDRTGENAGVVDYRDLSIMAEQWLQRSWLYGLE